MTLKRRLASSALWPMGDTKEDAAALQRDMMSEAVDEEGDPIEHALAAMFERDNIAMPAKNEGGSLEFS